MCLYVTLRDRGERYPGMLWPSCQRQRHLEPGILVGEYLPGDQPVGSFGQRRNHHENQSGPGGDGHQFLQPAQRLADRRAEGIRIREIAVAGDPDPEGKRNTPVTTRLLARLRRFHVRDRTPGDAARPYLTHGPVGFIETGAIRQDLRTQLLMTKDR
jgi:hypothetical protein